MIISRDFKGTNSKSELYEFVYWVIIAVIFFLTPFTFIAGIMIIGYALHKLIKLVYNLCFMKNKQNDDFI